MIIKSNYYIFAVNNFGRVDFFYSVWFLFKKITILKFYKV